MTNGISDVNKFFQIICSLCLSLIKKYAIQTLQYQGKVTSDGADDNGKYTVLINGKSYKIPCRAGVTIAQGDVVYVMTYNGNFSKKWIDMKSPFK